MKKIFKNFNIFLLTVSVFMVLIIKTVIFDQAINYLLRYIAHIHGYEISIDNLNKVIKANDSILDLQGLKVKVNENISIDINSVKINFNLINLLVRRPSSLSTTFNKVKLYIDSDNKEFIETSFAINYVYQKEEQKYQGILDILDIESNIINLVDKRSSGILKKSTCNFSIEDEVIISDCKINTVNNLSSLKTKLVVKLSNGTLKQFEGVINSRNLPLIVRKEFNFLLPNNKIWQTVTNLVEQGNIISSQIYFNLGREFFESGRISDDSLCGKISLDNVTVKYSNVYPKIIKIKSDVKVLGSKLDFVIKEAFLYSTKITNARVKFDWQKFTDTKIHISGQANGPVKDLVTGFIPTSSLHKLQSLEIDLMQANGVASTMFNIVVPIKDKVKSKYNVKTDIQDLNLAILKNKFKLSDGKMDGNYDGSTLLINGKGKINGMESTINYEAAIGQGNNFQDVLNITSLVNRKTMLGTDIVKITKGNAIVHFEYNSKAKNPIILVNSDLTNLGFIIRYTPVVKNVGEKAILQISSNLNNLNIYKLMLQGSNNLNVQSSIEFYKEGVKLNFPIFKHKKNNFTVNINLMDYKSSIKVRGDVLDLSYSNLQDFFYKSNNAQLLNNNIIINFNKVKLKNNVDLAGFYLKLRCKKHRCLTGVLESCIGQQPLKVILVPTDKYDQWFITTSNAGAIIKGLDISTDVVTGMLSMQLNVPHSFQEQITGEVKMEKFVTTKTRFLTRLVSFLSFPGLLNAITRTDNLRFTSMNLKFNCNNGNIVITKGEAEGAFLDFTIKGTVNTNQRYYDLHGKVYPALYGINTIVKKTPILNNIFSGKRKGIISANYRLRDKF